MSSYSTYALVALTALSAVSAHMQMSWPYPLHSTFNPNTPESLKDYSMTAPLVGGGPYPCKGYVNSPSGSPAMDSVTTVAAGSTLTTKFAGSAPHRGGSCQFSMSYDNGNTFNVIHSTMGGCMVDSLSQDITIPSSAPSGEALFAWSWFNNAGNREMYMNCAVVTVTGGGSGLTGPAPFVANAGTNDCSTIEGVDVVFPDPGPSIAYGGSYASSRPTAPAGITGSCASGGGSGSGSGGGAASSATSAAVSTEAAGSSSASIEVPPVHTAPVESAHVPTASPSAPAGSGRPGRPGGPGRPHGTEGTYTHTRWDNHVVTGSASASASATVDASAGGEVESSSTVVAEGAEATSATEAAPSSTASARVCRKKKRSIPSMAGDHSGQKRVIRRIGHDTRRSRIGRIGHVSYGH